jgi:ribosomal protein S8
MTKEEKEHLDGFNDGYVLQEYKPQLLEQILRVPNKNGYFQGLKDGKKQMEKELFKQQLKTNQQNLDLELGE